MRDRRWRGVQVRDVVIDEVPGAGAESYRLPRHRRTRRPSALDVAMDRAGLLRMGEAAKALHVTRKRLEGMCRSGEIEFRWFPWRGTKCRGIPANLVGR